MTYMTYKVFSGTLNPTQSLTNQSTIEICIQHLGRVEEMAFAVRRSYASAVLGVVILSVCRTRAL